MGERPSEFSEEMRRKATRVYYEAQRRGRLGLFETLTAKNADKIQRLLEEKALFARDQEHAPRSIQLDEGIAEALPEDFFANPSAWIEAQPPLRLAWEIGSDNLAGSIKSIEEYQHDADIERVKIFELKLAGDKTIKVVSKRINPKWEDWKEVETARRALKDGIPTPRILGQITDRGNLYAWFEYIPSINLQELSFILGDSYAATPDELKQAADRFLTTADRRRFDELLNELVFFKQQQGIMEELQQDVGKKLAIVPQAILDAGKSPQPFLKKMHRNVLAALPKTPQVQTLIEIAGWNDRETMAWNIIRNILLEYHRSKTAREFFNVPAAYYTTYPKPTRRQAQEMRKVQRQVEEGQKKQMELMVARGVLLDNIPGIKNPWSIWGTTPVAHEARVRRSEIRHLINNAVFGDNAGDWGPEYTRLREQYTELGYAEELGKALTYQNVIIAWDQTKDRPKRRADGSLDMYIIDWEKGGRERGR
jgi:hypothetical protein